MRLLLRFQFTTILTFAVHYGLTSIRIPFLIKKYGYHLRYFPQFGASLSVTHYEICLEHFIRVCDVTKHRAWTK